MPKLPEFSDKNYTLVGYVVAALITLSGIFLIYEVLFNSDLTFKANWNMFKSPLGHVCWIIGFVCAIIFWGKMGHWSATPMTEYRDGASGRLVKREENYDVTEQMFAKILLPVIGHFGLEPLVYGALIYYPIQCVIALVGTIFPYVLAFIVLAIIAGAWLFTHICHFRYRSLALIFLGTLFTVGFAWGGYSLQNAAPGSTIQMLTDSPTYGGSDTGGNETATEDGMIDDQGMDDQFEGYGEDGLLGSLPEGTTAFTGSMGGFPIELVITKDGYNVTAEYKNVKNSARMHLEGESLPAQGGDISFFGKDTSGNDWNFDLSGTSDNIAGTASSDGKQLEIKLRRQ